MKIFFQAIFLTIFSFISSSYALGKAASASGPPPIKLTESDLLETAVRAAPTLVDLEAQFQRSSVQGQKFGDSFKTSLFSNVSYTRTKEEPFIEFQPVISPHTLLEVGAQKKLPLGLSLKGSLNTDRREFTYDGTPFVRTIGSAQVSLSFDLWKNIWGRLDSAEAEEIKSKVAQSKINEAHQSLSFLNGLRALYWKWVALEEGHKISKKLVQKALTQEKDALQRFNNSVADKSELARYRAQSAERKGRLLGLEYQIESLIQKVKKDVGTFEGKELKLSGYDIPLVVKGILQCVSVINDYDDPPLENTLLDDLNREIQKELDAKIITASTYNAPDVQFKANLFAKAVDTSMSSALDEALSENRKGTQLSLGITIPLGRSKSKETDVRVQKLLQKAHQVKVDNQLRSHHQFMKKSINLLIETIQNQEKSRKNLLIRLEGMKRKYEQGRISVGQYIDDQNTYLNTELQILDSKYLVIETLLNYLAVFPLTPCPFDGLLELANVRGLL